MGRPDRSTKTSRAPVVLDLPRVELRAHPLYSLSWGLTGVAMGFGPAILLMPVLVAALRADWLLASLLVMFLSLPLLLFGYVGIQQLLELVRRSPRIVLDEVGLEARHLGVGRIPWGDLAGIRDGLYPAHVYLMLRDPERWIRRLPLPFRLGVRFNRLFGYPPFLLNLIGTGVDPEALKELLGERIEAARAIEAARRPPLPGAKGADSGGGEEPITTEEWMGEE